MKFNEAKYKVLHLGWSNPQYQYRLRDEGIESSPVEKDLGILMDKKFDVNWQCARAGQKANTILGCINKSMVKGGDFSPLLCYDETPHGVLGPALGSPTQERYGLVRAGPDEGHKNVGWNTSPMKKG
ncbi:rna-directed dna polymerase from mobile element jockey- hypothetical protein [Limosa lapponica baueri]|uniref:Rna-directed dna polymerase from mobile element jockey-like n=1 Tax=Limosa lapponica baueri TaxID=1758121 RepID=A0A2I0U8D1_LIMLA|nr:rna-directed dna polymerase from mobile element jockey- hypothetical protein [Limosa lapponica baueri]